MKFSSMLVGGILAVLTYRFYTSYKAQADKHKSLLNALNAAIAFEDVDAKPVA